MTKLIYDKDTSISNVMFMKHSFYRDNILVESFIEKYKDKVDWWWISMYQTLSEDFIIKYQDKVDWINISKYQKLSNKFIAKHLDKLFFSVKLNKHIDQVFIEKLELLK